MKSILHSIFGYLVLASFLVMLTPKDWLHDCKKEHFSVKQEHQSKGLSIQESNDTCAFCDLQIPVLGIAVFSIDFKFHDLELDKPYVEKDYCTFQNLVLFSNRGPPIVG
jgi:hypothetical protein